MRQRLARLDVRYRRTVPIPVAPVFDADVLTMDERHELDGLLVRVATRPLLPNGRPDFDDLSDDELERLNELAEKMQEVA